MPNGPYARSMFLPKPLSNTFYHVGAVQIRKNWFTALQASTANSHTRYHISSLFDFAQTKFGPMPPRFPRYSLMAIAILANIQHDFTVDDPPNYFANTKSRLQRVLFCKHSTEHLKQFRTTRHFISVGSIFVC